MSNVFAFRKPYIVNVVHDAEAGMWVASCDALFVATEAATFEALTSRVWLIVPEMIEANGLHIDPSTLQLDFQYIESADQRIAL